MNREAIIAKTLEKLKNELKNKKYFREDPEWNYHNQKDGYKQTFHLEIYEVKKEKVFFREESTDHEFKAPLKVFMSIPGFDKVLEKLESSEDAQEISCYSEIEVEKSKNKIKSFNVEISGKPVDALQFGKYLYDVLNISETLASGSLSDLD